MKKLGVLINQGRPKAGEAHDRLLAKAAAIGMEVRICPASSEETPEENQAIKEMVSETDVLVAMGGDGTLLRAARALGDLPKPIIGVNIGSLGFMTSVSLDDLERALDCLHEDNFTTTSRSIMEAHVRHDGTEGKRAYRALNDVVLHSGASSRVITLEVAINDQVVTSYVCDGLIVSTPTGSTGHALSAGGPIMVPGTSAFLMALICPHTLSSRPMAVPDDSEITILVQESAGELVMTFDGQRAQPVVQGDTVCLRRSANDIRLIHLPGYDYFEVLRQKLHWRGANI